VGYRQAKFANRRGLSYSSFNAPRVGVDHISFSSGSTSICHSSTMSEIDGYDYTYPSELVAQEPLAQRGDSRLLVVRRSDQSLHHSHIRDLSEWIRPNDCIILNDTRVLPARLVGRRAATGGKWTGLFLRADDQGAWLVLGKTRGKLSPGDVITLQDPVGRAVLGLHLLCQVEGGAWAARPDRDGEPAELLAEVGRVPLPPYIRQGEMRDTDVQRYQTVFAEQPGAVAAPTAGLHFTTTQLDELARAGHSFAKTTLHVGIGTFRPVVADRFDDHKMHSEWCQVTEPAVQTINEARAAGGRAIAVGTTVGRVLETASQDGMLAPFAGETDLFIRPGFEFRTVDALLTNFHLPRSTLLVLVRVFGGDELLKRAYAEAIQEGYRLFSYGDAMLIL
jgi:S-adenosylmethionine:tRNA ribosyltransferase-isomerase